MKLHEFYNRLTQLIKDDQQCCDYEKKNEKQKQWVIARKDVEKIERFWWRNNFR